MAADFVHYYGDKDVSLTNLYFPISLKHKTERDTVTLDAGLIRDNTLMSELQQTGAVLGVHPAKSVECESGWTRALTEKYQSDTSYQFNDVTYENGAPAGLADYRSIHSAAGGSYILTEKIMSREPMVYTNFECLRWG